MPVQGGSINFDPLKKLLTPGLLASDNNMTPTGDDYFDKRHARIMAGEDQFEPSELEQREMQNTRGTSTSGPYTSIMSRDAIRDSGLHELKRKLSLERIAHQQAVEKAQAAELVRGQFGLQEEAMRGQNAMAVAQERSRGDIESERLRAEGARDVARQKAGQAGAGNGLSDLYSAQRIERSRDAIARLLPQATGSNTGIRANIGRLPMNTPQGRFLSDLDTLKANIIQTELKEMRDASKTGSALGPVSDFENRLLSQAIDNLDPYRQSAEQIQDALRRIDAALQRWQRLKEQYGTTGRADLEREAAPDDDPYGLFRE